MTANEEWKNKDKYEIAKRLANEHWSYVGKICELMYKDAFIHGYGHGVEDMEAKSN